MNKKLQVFVSSTKDDMLEERQAAVDAILTAGHIPAGMELFAAGDESQLETIKRWIDNSDVFMLILGGRYGSIEPKSGKSYIQVEYEYAQKQKKCYFAVLLDGSALEKKSKDLGLKVVERDHTEKFNEFQTMVKSKICEFFCDAGDLKFRIVKKLAQLMEDEGLTGWVRGDQVVDAKKTLEQVLGLEFENKKLRDRIAELEQQSKGGTFAGLSMDELVNTLSAIKFDLKKIKAKQSVPNRGSAPSR